MISFCRIAALLLVPYLSLGEDVVFSEQFDGKELPKHWRGVRHAQDFKVADNVLNITLRPEILRAARLETDVPVIRKGTLEFDLTTSKINGQLGYGFYVELYGIRMFFHSACRDYRSYFPEPEQKRMLGFKIEPVGHQRIGVVLPGQKCRYWINFDADADRVEFGRYPDTDPEAIRTAVSVLAGIEFTGGKLAVGDIGYEGGDAVYYMDNIVLKEYKDQLADNAEKKGILIFEGFSANSAECLGRNPDLQKHIRRYKIMPQVNVVTHNRFVYQKFPSARTLGSAKAIILHDAPAGPDKCMPDTMINDIVKTVRNGATLVVLGGYFTLNKGEYTGTALEEILPVSIKDPFAVYKHAASQSLKAVKPEWQFAEGMNVLYQHDLSTKPGAEVLLTAAGKPMLVRQSCGKGEVLVFLGLPTAADGDNKIFFRNPLWEKFLNKLCSEKNK